MTKSALDVAAEFDRDAEALEEKARQYDADGDLEMGEDCWTAAKQTRDAAVAVRAKATSQWLTCQ